MSSKPKLSAAEQRLKKQAAAVCDLAEQIDALNWDTASLAEEYLLAPEEQHALLAHLQDARASLGKAKGLLPEIEDDETEGSRVG